MYSMLTFKKTKTWIRLWKTITKKIKTNTPINYLKLCTFINYHISYEFFAYILITLEKLLNFNTQRVIKKNTYFHIISLKEIFCESTHGLKFKLQKLLIISPNVIFSFQKTHQ
jgi:hypothetical protein